MSPPDSATIVYRLDAEITTIEDHELRRLLLASFPLAAPLLTRRYIRECPAHRWLVRDSAGHLVAHAAAHDKLISVAGADIRIGGIAEVCIAHSHRGQGLVRPMLNAAHAWMAEQGIPFAMLFGHPRVYASSGYTIIANPVHEDAAILQILNPFRGKTMVHSISGDPWPDGPVDLRGPTF